MTRLTYTAKAALLAALGLLLARPATAQVAQGTFTTLVQFTGNGGANPGFGPEGLTLDTDGSLYGVTFFDGANHDGTVFRYTPGANVFTSLASFTGVGGAAAGQFPYAALTPDGQGNFYGTTVGGGMDVYGYPGYGTIFEYTPATNTLTSRVSLTAENGANPGFSPYGGLTPDGQGSFYGTTPQSSPGGGNGSIYKYTPGTNTFTSLVQFTGPDGAAPGNNSHAGLTSDGQGNFYGTTASGGSLGDGTLFRYTPGTNTVTNLVNFSGSGGAAPGANPYAALLADGQGNFYGTTGSTLFKYAPGTNAFTTLVTFTGTGGAAPGNGPLGVLVLDGAGNIFGTTRNGGASNLGTVFEYSPGINTFTNLVQFTGPTGTALGASPENGLVIDSSTGTLYGSTANTGANATGAGTLWSLSGVAVAPAPEPSVSVVWGIGALGLGALGLRARGRVTLR